MNFDNIDNLNDVIIALAKLVAIKNEHNDIAYLEIMHSLQVTSICLILNINRNRYNYLKRTNKLDIYLIVWRDTVNGSEVI